jgi:translation initiation factor 2B subunit (eIF-2B alpha/beta/delta family)
MADVARDQGFERMLTISWSSSVVAALRLMRPASVLCMESQPGGEGRRAVAAIERFCRADLIADDDALENVPADAVITGADAVTPDAVINKMKTRVLAEAAASKRVPRYAIAGEAKFAAADLPPEEALETVPMESFTAVASPWGLLSPQDASVRARDAPLHPALGRLLHDLTKHP